MAASGTEDEPLVVGAYGTCDRPLITGAGTCVSLAGSWIVARDLAARD